MSDKNIMRKALGKQWDELPATLRAHYQEGANKDIGTMDIEYPQAMQPILNLLRLFGALLNRRGIEIPTTVEKIIQGESQFWKRTIRFSDGRTILFKSRWVYVGGNQLIEYVNSFLGLRMSVSVKEGKLYYEGVHNVIQLGRLRIPIPEWLMLGHTTIVESEFNETYFAMDFRLCHPLFGQIYRYAGKFQTKAINDDGEVSSRE